MLTMKYRLTLERWIYSTLLFFSLVMLWSGLAEATTDSHELGRKIYNFRCYFCHGYSGDAKTLATTYLNPKPLNFSVTDPKTIPLERMIQSITLGRPKTAMAGFDGILKDTDIRLVAEFVREEFMVRRAKNTRYHTLENGCPNHERYAIAFPFAKGEIPLDGDEKELSLEQIQGKALFFSTCITCHDRARVLEEGVVWERQAVSFPRGPYSHKNPPVDAVSGASPFAEHDRSPKIANLSPEELQGELLFKQNCAFCHGGDGTGKNWIGSFLDPHPRDLTASTFMRGMSQKQLFTRIQEGIPGSSMPAWKEVLTDLQIQNLVYYIARAFHPLTED